MDILKKTIRQIKSLKIQGATAVTRASLEALKKDIGDQETYDGGKLRKNIKDLCLARPTEPMVRNCLNYVLWQEKKEPQNLGKAIDKLLLKLEEVEEKIVENGKGLVKNGDHVLTHCHSSTVVSLLKESRKIVDFEVFLTETRPLFQGRITAKELVSAGIKTTMVVDSAAPYLISKEDEIPINLVILGADAIFPDGSCFNKIGSYGLGLAAKEAGVSLFVAGTLLKITNRNLAIEKREAKELWERKPKNLRILNLAFDYLPQEFITGIVTELGMIKPSQVKEKAKKAYPWIFA